MPSCTAANMVLERRKASMSSMILSGVVISNGFQGIVFKTDRAGVALYHGADSNARSFYARRSGVQPLVIFAVGQRLSEGSAFQQRHFVDLGGDTGGFA